MHKSHAAFRDLPYILPSEVERSPTGLYVNSGAFLEKNCDKT